MSLVTTRLHMLVQPHEDRLAGKGMIMRRKRNPFRMFRTSVRLIILTFLFSAAFSDAFAKDGLYICAEHSDPTDWEAEFAKGPVIVPAGTVFDYAGHIVGGNLQDPLDSAHFDERGWKGLSLDEKDRRSKLMAQDSPTSKNTGALATLNQVTLTKSMPCATAQAEVVLSKNWGWTISPIQSDATLYYQAYGVMRRGALDTDFSDDSISLNFLGARGELNASVRGLITKVLNLDQWSASRSPDEMPVAGKGNAECWNDSSRQDVSCRALRDNFLMSMRGASKADVVKAMNVAGREIEQGLHFASNYSRGECWGSGDVNFLFDDQWRVSVISAIIESPNSEGKHVQFIWNSRLLPAGCSDLPGSLLNHCN